MRAVFALMFLSMPVFAQSNSVAPAPPTRSQLLSFVLRQRTFLYEQKILVDGCSLRTAHDSVTSGIGVPDSILAAWGGNPAGNCTRLLPGQTLNTIVYLAAIFRGRSGVLPEGLPPDTYEGLYTVLLHVTRNGNRFMNEEWAVRPFKNGNLMIVGMRLTGIGVSD
jgi:hypothetical protein